MLELVLAGWVAMCGGGKLSDGWAALSRALQSPAPPSKEIDWVEYYKRQGYQINTSTPQWVSPQLKWAIPNNSLNGPPTNPHDLFCPPGAPGYPWQ
jgi:hypothetical protein